MLNTLFQGFVHFKFALQTNLTIIQIQILIFNAIFKKFLIEKGISNNRTRNSLQSLEIWLETHHKLYE